jgi:lipopolysaccharide export system protein LptC
MSSAPASSLHAPKRKVRRFRNTLTKAVSIGSVCAIIGLVGWFFIQAGTFGRIWIPGTVKGNTLPSPGKSDVDAAEFSGFDNSNEPYTINAESAHRDENDPSITYLKKVRGKLRTKSSGKALLIKAKTGTYEADDKLLDLQGNVEIVSPDEYTAFLIDAQVNVRSKRLRSEKPVHVVFNQGTIDAQAVEMWNNGGNVLFQNGVIMKITPDSNKGDAK